MNNQRFISKKKFRKQFQQKTLNSSVLISEIRSIQAFKKNETKEIEQQYMPQHAFADFPLSAQLQKNILNKGYTTPTPIQDQTINPILEGRDIIGIANTGTGKTAAFLIPLIDKISQNKLKKVLIVTPTRELALQIYQELYSFTYGLVIKGILCIGGTSIGRQKAELRQNHQFVIGTPGRIKDLIQERNISLSQFNAVVLDETDRMVDIGFISDIRYFISLLPRERQSLFFSATVSGKVREILQSFVHNPVTISVKQQNTSENIEQQIITIEPGYKKIDKLHDLLTQDGFEKVLIFGRTKWGIQKLTDELIKRGFKAGVIHGNKRQNQRQRILEQFKQDEIRILLATDVASRGLDIPNVSHVINYDLPASMEDYIHRIGRTGRASKKGVALTFVQ